MAHGSRRRSFTPQKIKPIRPGLLEAQRLVKATPGLSSLKRVEQLVGTRLQRKKSKGRKFRGIDVRFLPPGTLI